MLRTANTLVMEIKEDLNGEIYCAYQLKDLICLSSLFKFIDRIKAVQSKFQQFFFLVEIDN